MRHVHMVTLSASPAVAHTRIILMAVILHEGPSIISESCGFSASSWFLKYSLNSSFLNNNFQTNYNPRNLGVSTSEIQVVYKFWKGHLVTVLASCKQINHQSKSIKIHWLAVMVTKKCYKLCCKMYNLMWQVTSKTCMHLVYWRRQTCLTRIHLC